MSAASESLVPRSHLGSRLDWRRLSPFRTTNIGFRCWVHSGCVRKFSSRLILQELIGTSLLTVREMKVLKLTSCVTAPTESFLWNLSRHKKWGLWKKGEGERIVLCAGSGIQRGDRVSTRRLERASYPGIPPPQKKPCAMLEFAEDNLGNFEGLYYL